LTNRLSSSMPNVSAMNPLVGLNSHHILAICKQVNSELPTGNSAIIRLLMTVGGTGDDGDGETR